MDDSSPLFMQFKEFDADGDNKLTPDQVYQLLKLLGKNIYKGSVTSAAKLLNCNDQEALANPLFTFAQFKQFYESLQNPLKNDIWKGKYKILQYIKQIRTQINSKEDKSTAAPGAGKATPQDTPFRGDIEITVGPTNQIYDSFIQASVEKVPKGASKPFIKLVFEQSTNQSAKQLQTKFKKLQVNLFQLMKSSDPQSAQILDYIHIITNVSDTKLNVFVTTSNQALIQLGTLAADFLDQILVTKFSAKVQFKHEFCVDINKFTDKTANYSFYHALTKNYHTKLVWNAMNVKQAVKQLCKGAQIFQDFKYDKLDPVLLLLVGLLHTQTCQANFVFDNAQIAQVELQTKNQILMQLAGLQQKISQEGDLGILQTIAAFNNKVYIEASIGDWKAQVNIQIKDIVQQQHEQQQQQEQVNQVQINSLENKSQKSQGSVSSLKKISKKKSFDNSSSSDQQQDKKQLSQQKSEQSKQEKLK